MLTLFWVLALNKQKETDSKTEPYFPILHTGRSRAAPHNFLFLLHQVNVRGCDNTALFCYSALLIPGTPHVWFDDPDTNFQFPKNACLRQKEKGNYIFNVRHDFILSNSPF